MIDPLLMDVSLFDRLKQLRAEEDWPTVRKLCEEGLNYHRREAPSDYDAKIRILQALGDALQRLGDLDAAWLRIHEALLLVQRLDRSYDQNYWQGWLWHSLADIHFDRKEPAMGELLLKQSLSPLRHSEQHNLLAHVLLDLGLQAKKRNDLLDAIYHFEEAQEAARQAGSTEMEASIVNRLSETFFALGKAETGQQLLKEARTLVEAEVVNEDSLRSLVHITLIALRQSDLDTVWDICQTYAESLSAEYPHHASSLFSNSGCAYAKEARWKEAYQVFAQALSLARKVGSKYLITNNLCYCARVKQQAGDYFASGEYLRECLPLVIETNDNEQILEVFYYSMRLLMRGGYFVRIAQLLGAMDHFRQTPLETHYLEQYKWLEAQTRRHLLPRKFQRLREAGAALTLSEALALALEEGLTTKRRWLPTFSRRIGKRAPDDAEAPLVRK